MFVLSLTYRNVIKLSAVNIVKILRLLVLIVLLVNYSVITGCGNSTPEQKLKPGMQVPDLWLSDLKAQKFFLAMASGKTIILNIWATWCAPCRNEMPSLDRLHQQLNMDKFQVIGVSIDDDDHLVREFLFERKISFNNYIDVDMNEVKDKLGIRALPSTLIIGPDGKLLKLVEGSRDWDAPQMLTTIRQHSWR